jgi:hypothetical protein
MNAFQIQVEAALVSWDPSDCDLDAVRAAFTAAGFEDLCPKGRTEYEALKEAMATLKAKDQKIERHKAHEKNGCEIMQVERDTEVNEYARRRGARVVDGQIVCDPPLEFAEQYTVQQQYEKSLAEVPSRELSNALVAVVLNKLNGQRLRERGALYFIPQESIPKWYLLSDLLDVGAGVKLFAAETNINERTAEWVTASLTKQILAECAKIQEEVASLSTPDAIELRKTRAMEMELKVARYKNILGKGLEDLERATQDAQTAALIAAMKSMQAVAA